MGGLKVGEAVMIVATSTAGSATAVTLLAGVEPILAASPAGGTMTLSPWSMGGGADAAGGAQ
jgi:predicted ABC-type transport system involved in lysophospholipase L1 biosynthesis ATPase subunit